MAAAGLIPRSPVRSEAPLVVRVPPMIKEYDAAVRKLTGRGFSRADAGEGTERNTQPMERIADTATYFFSSLTSALVGVAFSVLLRTCLLRKIQRT
jgi:hypothetical protein